jgi:hypothetical protein
MTTKRRSRLRCLCDALGSGVCPDCRALVSRRLNTAKRGSAPAEAMDQIVDRWESQVSVAAPTDVRRSDISSRLHCAATLIADGECSLEAVLGLVASTARRLECLHQDELEYSSSGASAHEVRGVS